MMRSLESIRSEISKLEAQARIIERSNTKGLQALSKVITKYDLTMNDLKEAMSGKARRSPLAGKTVAPKFRDSKGNTWTGRGRTPLWLVAAEKAGRKRESFLI